MAGQVIQIPGLTDVIVAPGLENAAAREERVARLKVLAAARGEPTDPIPSVINWLDDIEDMMITVLPAIAWLAKRWLPELLGPVGWILAAASMLNVVNGSLALWETGPLQKQALVKQMLSLPLSKRARMLATRDYLASTGWAGWAVQAGQVVYNITGYGLRLGGIFGMLSSTFWAGIGLLQGELPVILAPPASDPLSKAVRTLAGVPANLPHCVAFTDADQQLICAGINAAATYAAQSAPELVSTWAPDRGPWSKYPWAVPWNLATVNALAAQGIDPTKPAPPPYYDWSQPHTGGEQLQWFADAFNGYMGTNAEQLPATPANTAIAVALGEAANLNTGILHDYHPEIDDPNGSFLRYLWRVVEISYVPPVDRKPGDIPYYWYSTEDPYTRIREPVYPPPDGLPQGITHPPLAGRIAKSEPTLTGYHTTWWRRSAQLYRGEGAPIYFYGQLGRPFPYYVRLVSDRSAPHLHLNVQWPWWPSIPAAWLGHWCPLQAGLELWGQMYLRPSLTRYDPWAGERVYPPGPAPASKWEPYPWGTSTQQHAYSEVAAFAAAHGWNPYGYGVISQPGTPETIAIGVARTYAAAGGANFWDAIQAFDAVLLAATGWTVWSSDPSRLGTGIVLQGPLLRDLP